MWRITYITKIGFWGQVLGDFELAIKHYVCTFNTATTATVTNDARGIKVKLLGNI